MAKQIRLSKMAEANGVTIELCEQIRGALVGTMTQTDICKKLNLVPNAVYGRMVCALNALVKAKAIKAERRDVRPAALGGTVTVPVWYYTKAA